MKIYETKIRKRTLILGSCGANNELGCDSHSFENTIDAGCFNPENWDLVMRSYIKKR